MKSILEIAQEIFDDKEPAAVKHDVYSLKYPVFFKEYPVLAKSVVNDDTFDMGMLNYMCSKKREISAEFTEYEASVMVGQRLSDKYIKPIL